MAKRDGLVCVGAVRHVDAIQRDCLYTGEINRVYREVSSSNICGQYTSLSNQETIQYPMEKETSVDWLQ